MIRPSRTRRRSAYRSRERDYVFMGWIKRQPCIVRELPPDPNRITPCSGHVEADHLGSRPVGRKADDSTCAPICSQHHRERTTHWGCFRNLVKAELREWRGRVLELVGLRWAVEQQRRTLATLADVFPEEPAS